MLNLKEYPGQRLIKLLRKKDRSALISLYDTYAPALYGVILRWVGDEAIAQRILQKVFLEIWQKCTTYECTKQTLFAWMYAIAKRTAQAELSQSSQDKNQELVA